jgi:small conductance mechanosensitive channel
VIPLAEEDALYVWIWWLRMARYTVFYSAITGGLDVMGLDPLTHDLVRGLLLAIYPVLLTLLVLQVRAELAGRFRLSALVEPIPLESSQSPAADVAPSENGSKGTAQEADRSASAGTGEGDPTKTQVSAEPSGPPPAEPPSPPNGFRKIFRLLLRFWWPLALGYVWAVFIALIGRYQSGLDYLVTATGQTVLAGLGLAFVLTLHHYGFLHLFAVNRRVRAKFPGLEEKTDRYLQVVRQVAKWLIVFVTLFILAQIWGIPVGGAVSSPRGLAALGRVLAVAFSVGVVAAVIETSRFVKRRLLEPRTGLEPSQKIRTFVPLVNTTIITVACFLGGVVVLGQLGVNVGPILAGAGIVGLAVGLGAQSLVKDFINGLFILVQDMIAVGDFIQVGDKSGQVEAITLRSVRIRDVSGNVHIIPSGMIDTVTNMSKVFSRYVLDVGVAYREDVDQVMELLRRIGREMEADPVFGPFILAPLEVLGVDRFDESAVVIRARVTTRPSRQWEVGREFNRRIKMLFDEYGIEIPFPHQTLYFGEPKTGPAPALRVIQVESGKGEGTRRLPDEHLPEPEEPAAEEAKDSDW